MRHYLSARTACPGKYQPEATDVYLTFEQDGVRGEQHAYECWPLADVWVVQDVATTRPVAVVQGAAPDDLYAWVTVDVERRNEIERAGSAA